MNNPSVASGELEQAASELIGKIEALETGSTSEAKLIRLETEIPPVQLRKWLSAHDWESQ